MARNERKGHSVMRILKEPEGGKCKVVRQNGKTSKRASDLAGSQLMIQTTM